MFYKRTFKSTLHSLISATNATLLQTIILKIKIHYLLQTIIRKIDKKLKESFQIYISSSIVADD